jgi:Na+-translocating ferredoxin:NAD+ oxidoreductase RnfC subunit
LNRNSAILEKIEDDGIPAYLENNIKNAKKIRDKIKVNKLETNAKL